MSIEREHFHQDPEAARDFLEGREGVLLHELGHYVAANLDGLVSGHIIVEDRECRDCTAALHIVRVSRPHIEYNPARRELIASAGALTELYFCKTPILRRLGPDIEMYFGPHFVRQLVYQFDREAAIMLWREHHLDRLEKHANCIQENFRRCAAHLASKRYLIDGFHVIPSGVLSPPTTRSIVERLDDWLRTFSKRARRRALIDYLEERARVRATIKPC